MQRISKAAYERRLGLLSCTAAAWSPLCTADERSDASPAPALCCAMLAIGTKSGRIWLWRQQLPPPSQSSTSPALVLCSPPGNAYTDTFLAFYCSIRLFADGPPFYCTDMLAWHWHIVRRDLCYM